MLRIRTIPQRRTPHHKQHTIRHIHRIIPILTNILARALNFLLRFLRIRRSAFLRVVVFIARLICEFAAFFFRVFRGFGGFFSGGLEVVGGFFLGFFGCFGGFLGGFFVGFCG